MKNYNFSPFVSSWSLLFLLFLFFFLPTVSASAQQDNSQDFTEVIAAFPKNFPPQCFLDENGTPTGFAIDVMNQVAKIANLKVVYRPEENWVDTTNSLFNGTVDLIPNSGITDKRLLDSDFTIPVETFAVVIFVRETTHNIKSLADLKGRKVAVLPLNVGRKIVDEQENITGVVYNEISTALFDLMAGKVDAFIYPKPVALKLARDAGIEERIKIVGESLVEIKRAIRVRKGEELLARLNPAVEEFLRSADYQRIYRKWYGKPRMYWTASRVALAMGSLLLLIICTMFTWRYKSLAILNIQLKKSAENLHKEMGEKEQINRQLLNIEWLLKKTIKPYDEKDQYAPPYGDLVGLNTKRVILDSVGSKMLNNITGDFLDLLESSSAVYETNGDYAQGIFSSGWCKFLDNASRNLCTTDDNREALESGLWLCHESCWTEASKVAIETGQPTDIECHGGIRLYALPIISGQEIVGAINVGHGAPPTDRQKLQEIAEKYDIPLEELIEKAEAYQERPKYILEIAKKRLHSAARLIGEIVERKRTEEKLWQSQNELEQRVETRTTELRKSKEEWEKTFEAIGDIAIIMDPNLRVVRVNQKACDAFNAKPDELIGKLCYKLFRGATEPCQGCPVAQGVKDFKIHGSEIRHENLGKTFMVSASPVVDTNGEITSVVHFAKDITEQKNLEKRLGQAQKMEAIGTLAGGIAHDFNNILAAIIGYSEIALEDISSDSSTASDIHQVLKAGNRATELVKQILSFSRQAEQELQPLKVQLVAKEALKLLRSSIPTTIEVKQNIDPECGAVLADPTQIHQIVMNLCTNAYHAMRETGGVLAVALTPVELGPDDLSTKMDLMAGLYVQLTVSDTGYGMDKIVLERIFDPYYTTKGKGEGTGLGLSVVHGIVKSLHGDITVYSEPGKGTTFHVYFPVVETKAGKRVDAEVAARLPSGDEHILVVDDEEMIVDMEQQMLSSLGYQVSRFTNCEEALKAFRTQPNTFDLIITDMTMPKITGLQLTKEVLAVRTDIPVILCTGFSELINEEKAQDAGICRYLMKPLLKKDLAIAVREVLDKSKLEAI